MKKAAIILPILGKHHKEAMLRAAAVKDEKEKVTAVKEDKEKVTAAQLPNRPLPVIRPSTPEAAGKRRRPGRPRKAVTSQSQG